MINEKLRSATIFSIRSLRIKWNSDQIELNNDSQNTIKIKIVGKQHKSFISSL